MRSTQQLLLANKAWSIELTEENPEFFRRQVAGQRPDFLWIGCSDSRVSPEQMTQSQPGGMFIHRNIANLVNDDDLNLMSVLQFAVTVLKVRHVVVCGHYGCGGVKAAVDGGTTGPVDRWLANVRDVHEAHRAEVDAATRPEGQINRLVEVNVRDQLLRLARTDTVREAFAAGQELALHGWVYDLRDGLLKPLLEIEADTLLDEIGAPGRVLV